MSEPDEDGWVQETWESEEDMIRDFSLLPPYSVPSQSGKHLDPAPVPDTILQYRKLMAENQQKILDSEGDKNVSYLSSPGIGIDKRIIRSKITIDSHPSNDVELSKNIPEVSEKRYSSGMTEESTKAKIYESKSNSAISNFVDDEWVQETWESEDDIKRDLASLTQVDSKSSLVPDTILQYRKEMAKNKQKNLNSESYESVSHVRNRGIGIGRKMIWPKKPIDSYVSDDVELLKNIPEVYEKRYSSGMMGESAKAEVYESKSNIAISKDVEDGWVQETWESEEDIIRDFSLLALYSVPSQNGKHLEPAPVPDTILQYRKLMAENQQKILDRKSDQNVSYLSSRDIGIEKRIIQPRKTIDSHSSDDVELSKNILEVSGRRYLSGMAGESTKPMVYESKSNSAISKVVEDGRVQKTWKSKDGIKRDLAFLSLFDSESGFVPNTILQYRKKMSRNKQKNLNSESDESVFHVRKRGTEIGRRMIQPKKPIDSYLSDDVELSKNIPEVSQRYSSGMTGELIKAKIYESKSNSAISKVQKTWESKKDIKKDFASLVDFKPGPVPDTVIQYRKMMAENKQKILDSKSDQSVSYLSSPGIRIGKKIIRPKKTLECHFSDDVELSNIPEVSGMEYLSGPIKESEKAKTYKYKSNRAISKVVLPSSSSSDESSAENTSTKYFEPVDLNLLKDNFSPLE